MARKYLSAKLNVYMNGIRVGTVERQVCMSLDGTDPEMAMAINFNPDVRVMY